MMNFSYQIGNGGSLEIEDDYGNYMVCDWVKMEEKDRLNAVI
jgi:hypothetical protein